MSMKSAQRDKKHNSFTIAICPSDKHIPYYISISIPFIIIFTICLVLVNTYSYILLHQTNTNWKEAYQEIHSLSKLQNLKVTMALAKHKKMTEHIHKLKKQEEEIKELLSLNFDADRPHKVDLYSYPMIATHRIISKKGEFGRVLIDNAIIVEYFDDSANPTAYQRAQITAERIKSLLASKSYHRKYSIRQVGDKISAYINNQIIFVIYPADVKYLEDKISARELAKHWLENIKIGLARQEEARSWTDRFPFLDRENRKKSKLYYTLYPTIDYPVYTVVLDNNSGQRNVKQVDHLLRMAQQEVTGYKKSFLDLKNTVQSYKTRFEYTPSIYPVRNSFVLSEFGWRMHPILRRVRFHTGVDLPNFEGAPVVATAAGVVTKEGWLGGYGQRIEIDHGYGFSTVYGHNSANLVGVGQRVYKGQMIGKVGRTGLAQGDHCHYEVRFFDRPVNPVRFLNLNIFTASKNW